MPEQLERICVPSIYTYDQFTVFFYDERVYLSNADRPIGQCCVDIMNMDEEILNELDRRVDEFLPAAWEMLSGKKSSAVDFVQRKLNDIWDIIFTMPVYCNLNMDVDLSYHLLERLYEQKEKWEQMQDPRSKGYKMYLDMIMNLKCIAERIRVFRQQILITTEKYLEPLERRNRSAYAEAFANFYTDMLNIGAIVFNEDFEQSFSMQVNFVPMMTRTDESEVFIAEKATFNNLLDFLRVEFYRGLSVGNAPRRCHNCGSFFLLTAGYNTCYCNNIAPGETVRTCRKVGAHRKETVGKANRSPARVEYDRVYNRLKQKKNRGKISVDEWNATVAKAMQVLEQAERGELADDEMKEQFRKF